MNKIQIEISLEDLTFIDNLCLNHGYTYPVLLKEMIKRFKEYENKNREKDFIQTEDIREESDSAEGADRPKEEAPRARRKK